MNTKAKKEHSRSKMKSRQTVKDNSHGVSCLHKGCYWDCVGELNPAIGEVTCCDRASSKEHHTRHPL